MYVMHDIQSHEGKTPVLVFQIYKFSWSENL